MLIQKLEADFIHQLEGIYTKEESLNIFNLALEYLTGINMRSQRPASFHPDGCFTKMWNDIIQRLLKNEPIQYILNEAWFYDIPFFVNDAVLIPRPETEELANWIIKEHHHKEPLSILDIGSGSGCIPIILKKKIPQAAVFSCDISEDALKVAQKNAIRHQSAVTFFLSDFLNKNNWADFLKTDIIVSNPPYIPQKEKNTISENVLNYEPHLALFVDDKQPLIFYEYIAQAGKQLLNKAGNIYVEIFEELGAEVMLLFQQFGYEAYLKKDMQGKDRFIKAIL